MITLKLKISPDIPVEAESIIPDNFKDKTAKEICELPVWCGNRQETLGGYFEVNIDADYSGDLPKIVIQGDLSRFKRIGQGMTGGEIEIQSSIGFHAGSFMKGGQLTIKGNAGDWLGAHMEGGRILVEGSVGNYVAAAHRGMTGGMKGGTILIKGNAGQMLGSRMKGGLIAVGGNCGDLLGFKMAAGTIVVLGNVDIRPGANMVRGTIITFTRPVLLPTFYYNCQYQPLFWKILHEELCKSGFPVGEASRNAVFVRFTGDANAGGKGEILICQ